ncbi:protein BatD [bacterium]|nr:protein BatD [bacterium]
MKINMIKSMDFKVLLIIGIAFLLFPQLIFADYMEVISSISADRVGLEDTFIYTINVETDSRSNLDIDLKMTGFPTDYRGPSVSNQSSTSFSNGQWSHTSTKKYQYTVYPREVGDLIIPPLTVVVNGKEYKTQKHSVKIVEGSLRPKANTNQRRSSGLNQFFDPFWDDSFYNQRKNQAFIEVEVSRDSIYVGQSVTVTYTYYANSSMMYQSQFGIESFDGYGIENNRITKEKEERVRYKGSIYTKKELATLTIVAHQAGKLTLPQITLETSFFNNDVKSPSTTLLVKKLPDRDRAIDFSNAIGEFKVDAKLNQSIMLDNQQNQLILTISGRGNFSRIIYPQIPPVEGLEILKPKATIDSKADDSGSLILTYGIIPYESGKFKIPPVSLNYFDDKAGKYKTIYTDSKLLTVKSSSSTLENLTNNPTGIFYTKNKPYLGNITQEYLFTNKVIYWILMGILLASILSYLVFFKIQKKRMSDIGYVRRKDALKLLKKAINESSQLVETKDIAFYTLVQNYLLKFISIITKASLQLSQQELMKELDKSNVNKNTIAKINAFLSYCEQVKYQPNFPSKENIPKDFARFKNIYDDILNGQR